MRCIAHILNVVIRKGLGLIDYKIERLRIVLFVEC